MSFSRVFVGSVLVLMFANGCSLIGFASMKKAESERKKLQDVEKVVEDVDEFEMSDIYYNTWDMKEVITSSGEQIAMKYRGRVFVSAATSESDSVYTIPLYHNRVLFLSGEEMMYEGYVNRVKRGENGVWIFEMINPDTTLASTIFDSAEIMVESDLTFDALRYGLESFDDLPFEQKSTNYSYSRYRLDVDAIQGWGIGAAISDTAYRVIQLDDVDEITYKSGPIPPSGMGSAIFMGFAVVTDIAVLLTLGLVWLL